MSPWAYVFLAYGIVSTTLFIYFCLLKRRLKKAQNELAQLRSLEESEEDAKR